MDYISKDVSKFDNAPLVQTYYYACKCFLNKPDENSFIIFKNHFDLKKNKLTNFDKKNIYSLILTYYNQKNSVKKEFDKECLSLHIEMMNNVIGGKNSKYIDSIEARNIIILCMNLNEKKIFRSF